MIIETNTGESFDREIALCDFGETFITKYLLQDIWKGARHDPTFVSEWML